MVGDDASIAPHGEGRALRRVVRGVVAAWREPVGSALLLTQEQFQSELVALGLFGMRFSSRGYADALSRYLDLPISVHVVPDGRHPAVARRLALSGRLAELRLCERDGVHEALILVPESLPPLVFALTVLHELGHLASGDHLTDPLWASFERDRDVANGVAVFSGGKRLARRPPLSDERLREKEADLRASFALVAGCLGDEHPCARKMYDVL